MPSREMQDVIEQLRLRRADRPAQPPSLDQVRANFLPAGKQYELPEDIAVSEVSAAGVPAYWVDAPGVDSNRVLLYVHGGGFSLGSLRSHGELVARVGRAAGVRVLFPEYRLAPEHPYPAALDDVLAVWNWLRADQSVPADSIVLAGDSAGGTLVAALLIALRDAGEQPRAAALLSPVVDMTVSGDSVTENDGVDAIFTPDMLRGAFAAYVGAADPRSPLVSPLFGKLDGLPPLLIQAGSAELLLSDAERFAEAAVAAGVEVTLQVRAGLPHVYPIMGDAPEAREATDDIGAFLRQRLG
ncbi:MAG: alpha/beta hydrolase [Nocardia sp.]|uniref:alpha/beta hydrolase n=1 Tax=Nocardia sp. TaxID=1821 RepID=UPI00262DB215|nr:alpha/beta hydrolase [Nocardia sp.]MCU1643304.1 alpha/beta hydrolase [Nocardia sp.]